MRNRHLLGRLALVAGCCAVCMALGCDGMVGVEGWVVEAPPGEKSDVTMKEKRMDQPQEGVIQNAWVELWTGNGKRLLERQEPGLAKDGFFGVGKVGPYERGMRYLIKAGAPGYQPLSKEVKLRVGGDSALIQLAPIKQEDGRGQ